MLSEPGSESGLHYANTDVMHDAQYLALLRPSVVKKHQKTLKLTLETELLCPNCDTDIT